MGANSSHSDSNLHHVGGHGYEGKKSHHHHQHAKAGLTSGDFHKPSKKGTSNGKPSPPSQPQAKEVTHNSVTLSWLPPRHNAGNKVFAYTVEMTTPREPKAWTVVTKSCQGNSYQVKNLKPESEYMFRVRAENIHGVSKGSRPSDVVETKLYEVEEVYADPVPQDDKSRNPPRRRHSINLHLEGGVTSILNHTDIQVKATEPKVASTASSDQELDKDGQRSRSNTLQRDVTARNSLQWRKRSLPLLLPGTKTNSLSKLRDSQTFPNIKSKAGDGSTDSLQKRRGEGSLRNRSASDVHSSCSGSKEDVTDAKSCSSKSESSADDDLSLNKRDSKRDSKTSSERDSRIEEEEEEENENPWERDDSVNEVSDRIRTAPLCDDIKIALYARTVPDDPTTESGQNIVGRSLHTVGPDGGDADFRTLQRLLHSDEIIVKPTRSLPDVVTVGKTSSSVPKNINNNNNNSNNNNNNKLTTIQDLDEDDASVRVTTL
ncbi:uncharacterized protein [Littorina saxatilis]|uniref:Fibronectin type-III domain-containing protein n=1 Tax=Littorina saxatilis TaxID=31220 RepID=A0AAN9GLM6_9CAEN